MSHKSLSPKTGQETCPFERKRGQYDTRSVLKWCRMAHSTSNQARRHLVNYRPISSPHSVRAAASENSAQRSARTEYFGLVQGFAHFGNTQPKSSPDSLVKTITLQADHGERQAGANSRPLMAPIAAQLVTWPACTHLSISVQGTGT